MGHRGGDTQFVKKLGDTEILALILEGSLGSKGLAYDVLTVEGDYLLSPERRWQPFCEYLRSTPAGDKLCYQCDLEHMSEASQKGDVIDYVCHAGMWDIVAPIFVEDEPLAAIFTGQAIGTGETQNEATGRLELAKEAAREAGVDPDRLWGERQRTRPLDPEQRKAIKRDLAKIASYLQQVALEHHVVERLSQRSTALLEATAMLSSVPGNTDEAWKTITKAIRVIHRVIDTCIYSGVFVLEGDGREFISVKATSNLPATFKDKRYDAEGLQITSTIQRRISYDVQPFSHTDDSLHRDIYSADKEEGVNIKSVVFVPLDLGTKKGALAFFLKDAVQRMKKSKSAETTTKILCDLAATISHCYSNAVLSQQRQQDQAIRNKWLRAIGHQWKIPMHAIFGYVERLQNKYRQWAESDPQKIDDALETIRMLAHRGTDIANNLLYYRGKDGPPLRLVVEHDLRGLLIAKARDFQAMARGADKFGPDVDADQVSLLNGKIAIHRDYFTQACVNLLDNAVKYADRGTRITVTADLGTDRAYIYVSDIGIPVEEEESERIFDPEFRTDAAERRDPIGTGIGLAIARDIIEAHQGKLTVMCEPATGYPGSYQVTFTISLPRSDHRRNAKG